MVSTIISTRRVLYFFQMIARVNVLKRATYKLMAFDDVELRIGNVDSAGAGRVHLTGNALVGFFDGPATEELEVIFDA